ncbi:MAG: rhomboid family intramembrane serine protease [Lachnospiraceae bacterium]|nr:rhomboid family intramembrane serine protease [Lachnospiraceae bacterium]
MLYVIVVYAAGYIVSMINPDFYYEWLMLDIDKLLHGQVWRLVTFLIQPIEDSFLFLLLMLWVYYSIGNTLERVWGTFFFNVYYFMGVIFNILAVIVIYIMTRIWVGYGLSYPVTLYYLNLSMLLAFAVTFPEVRFYLMFIIPFKAKYLSILYAVILTYSVIRGFMGGVLSGCIVTISILFSLANFFIYFAMMKGVRIRSPKEIKRRMEFKNSYMEGTRANLHRPPVGSHGSITRHKCAVCGRSELDGDNLQFRFCSKCNGNYEYCQDHLFTHVHIQ